MNPDAAIAELSQLSTQPVLTWIAEDGYPASARVAPGPVKAEGIAVPMPAGVEFRAGPASLMGHSHNERMWDIKGVLFRGTLVQVDEAWVFTPKTQVGAVKQGARDMMRFMGQAKQVATRYLEKRGLPRPTIPWADIQALKTKAKELGIH